MIRPLLKTGDLVMRVKPNDGKVYRVVRMIVNKRERRKLRLTGSVVSSSEGFVDVYVQDKEGRSFNIKRRDLWRIPNQPRDKAALSKANPQTRYPHPPQMMSAGFHSPEYEDQMARRREMDRIAAEQRINKAEGRNMFPKVMGTSRCNLSKW